MTWIDLLDKHFDGFEVVLIISIVAFAVAWSERKSK